MPSKIEDYALISDCQTAALVSRIGSIDWLCMPRFDSPACFAALLDNEENGRFLIQPCSEPRAIRRRYVDGTLVLETEFTTPEGRVTLVDFMPPRERVVDLVRIVRGERGQVRMRLELIIRFDYGSIVPWVRKKDGVLRATAGPDTLYVRTPIDLSGHELHTVAEFVISEGEAIPIELVWVNTHDPQPVVRDPFDSLNHTLDWWRTWSQRCWYHERWEQPVKRSLITLKGLTYAPTGGIVAAATTSLPEYIGGVRNWDYRYCWLRDATFTLFALMVGGYVEEAKAWREWLVNAVAGSPEVLQIMYGIAGERRLTEFDLPWLSGYEGSRPVRTGNAAYNQFQLDVYGETMDALHSARKFGLPPDENAWRVQRAIMRSLEKLWQEPDEGIWEVRAGRRHFTHSKVMAWVAADRAVKSVEEFGLVGDVEKWRKLRRTIFEQVCREGFDAELNSFVQYYGSKEPDASLLSLPMIGFLPAEDPRMRGTVNFIEKELSVDGLVHRYRTSCTTDGLPAGEGAFLLCSFWLADNLVLQGRTREAEALFERLLDLRNDVGLLSEQYDQDARRMLGNFPQAFSHVGLVNTARNLIRHGGPAEERQH